MLNRISKDIVNKIKQVTNEKENKVHHLHEPLIEKKDIKKIRECIDSGFVSSVGKHCDEFKKKIKIITKSKYVILTSSGSSALHLILQSLNIQKNCEVLIPNFNYIASTNSVLLCNAAPHFIDVEEKTLGIDVIKLEKYLKKIATVKNSKCFNKKTGKEIRACIALHTYGYSCDIIKIRKLLKEWKIILLEDSAEALGSYFKKKHLGTFGYAGIFSFNGNKTITTGGGGAIVTSNKKFAKICSHLSTTAKVNHKYLFYHDRMGFNYRLPNLNAALGVSQIEKLNNILRSKKLLNQRYKKIFKKCEYLTIYKDRPNSNSNYWLNIAILNKKFDKQKDKIISYCIKNSINLRPGWKLMHQQDYLKKYPKMNLKQSIDLYKRLICLPSSPIYFIKK
mgnify:CR=1 FL=1